MNRFVLIKDEDYDCYTVPVAYPVETELSYHDLLGVIRAHGEKLIEAQNAPPDPVTKYRYTPKELEWFEVPGSKATIEDIQFWGESIQLGDTSRDGGWWWGYKLKMPELLTIDEWFARASS